MEKMENVKHQFPGLFLYEGMVFSEVFTPQSLQAASKFKLKPTDVLLSSYPKSGKLLLFSLKDMLYPGMISKERHQHSS